MTTISYLATLFGAMMVSQSASVPFTIPFAGKTVAVSTFYEESFPRFEYQEDDAPSFSLTFPRQPDECSLLTLVSSHYNSEDTLVETTLYGRDDPCNGNISNSYAADLTYDGYNSTSFRPLSLDEQVRIIGLYMVLQKENVVGTALRAARESLKK